MTYAECNISVKYLLNEIDNKIKLKYVKETKIHEKH